jgi:hypothetical protein
MINPKFTREGNAKIQVLLMRLHINNIITTTMRMSQYRLQSNRTCIEKECFSTGLGGKTIETSHLENLVNNDL